MSSPAPRHSTRCVPVPGIVALILLASVTGCTSDAVVTGQFLYYDRVAIWPSAPREVEDLFLPLYMDAFPNQMLLERRDVATVLGEQDMLPDRLDDDSRARLRRILGVKGIVFPSIAKNQFAIKVIDTETGAITASAFVEGKVRGKGKSTPTSDLVRKAVKELKKAEQEYRWAVW